MEEQSLQNAPQNDSLFESGSDDDIDEFADEICDLNEEFTHQFEPDSDKEQGTPLSEATVVTVATNRLVDKSREGSGPHDIFSATVPESNNGPNSFNKRDIFFDSGSGPLWIKKTCA